MNIFKQKKLNIHTQISDLQLEHYSWMIKYGCWEY